jgi:hypothetical protein
MTVMSNERLQNLLGIEVRQWNEALEEYLDRKYTVRNEFQSCHDALRHSARGSFHHRGEQAAWSALASEPESIQTADCGL